MGFFKKIFGGGSDDATNISNEPAITFGRYSDSFKNNRQVGFWQEATAAFKENEYIKSYDAFFKYLKDEHSDNVKHTINDDGSIDFEILQGSKKLVGKATAEKVNATVKVVKCNSLNVAFMRKLMERNYSLRYGRFALDDEKIWMKFSTSTIDGSPEKLYYALKEVAVQADKQDDLLVNEFSMLEAIDTGHINVPSEEFVNIKVKWLRKLLQNAIDSVKDLDPSKFDGGIAYVVLSTLFKTDYLITPEGKVMDMLEKTQAAYYNQRDNKSTQEKNAAMLKSFQEILELDDAEIKTEIYDTTSTFGLGSPTGHKVIHDMIENVGNGAKYNIDNNYPRIAQAQLEYIAGYGLFFYGLQHPTRRYFEFAIQLLNQDYYEELGFSRKYIDGGKPNKKLIQAKLNEISNENKDQYPGVQVNPSGLNYADANQFVYSLMKEVQKLNYPQN